MIKYKFRPCSKCDTADAVLHPLAIGAIVTVLRIHNGLYVREGIATILRTSSEPDTYFARFNGIDKKPRKRVILIESQADPARWIDLLNRHLKQEADDAILISNIAHGQSL